MNYPDLGLILSIRASFNRTEYDKLSDSQQRSMAKNHGVVKWIKAASISNWDQERQSYVYSSLFTGQTAAGLSLYDPLEILLADLPGAGAQVKYGPS